MTGNDEFGQLLRKSLVAIAACVALVAVAYFYVDRPVAMWVHTDDFSRFELLRWLTDPPPLVQTWTPVVFGGLMVRRAWGPLRRGELTLFAACLSLLVADQFKDTLAYLAGRTWPETWVNNNPSFIRNGAFGFHPFHVGDGYESFPSGHTARTLGAMSVVWIVYPHWRWVCLFVSAAIAIGLIGMNYHFVGDVIAGAFVGAIVGTYATHLCGLTPKENVANKANRVEHGEYH